MLSQALAWALQGNLANFPPRIVGDLGNMRARSGRCPRRPGRVSAKLEPSDLRMTTSTPLRYEELGRGDETIVFLHGLLGRPADFREVMEILADRYRVIAFQLPIDPPHDDWTTRAYSIGSLSDWTDELFRDLDLDGVTLCGHSLGGHIAVDYCLRYPERVARLALTASAGLYEYNVSSGVRPHACKKYVREIGRDVFFDTVHITDDHVNFTCDLFSERNTIRYLLRVAKDTRDHNVKQDLCRLNLPTLLLWGENDVITPPFVAKEFQEGIHDSKLVYLPECGHAPPLEHPHAFANRLDHFVSEHISPQKFLSRSA